jgi:uncharacterized protein YmfQ (DUF2313 family)
MTKDDYKTQLIALLPPGVIWPAVQTSSTFISLLDALAEELARIDARVENLMLEVYPDTSVELLTDWERVAGLPDNCTGEIETLQQRHSALMGVLTIQRSLSRQFFIDIAARLGFVITITELAGYTWRVNATLDVNAVYFRTGVSVIGDPLVQSLNNLLECAMQTLKPAHTIVTFNYI